MLICVDEAYIRKIAVEANEMVSMGLKLPTSLVSTAPEEFQVQTPTGKLSKTKKKKLKKKAKLQNELIRMQMEHLQQTEPEDIKGTKENDEGAGDGTGQVDEHLSVTATISNNDESPTDNETSASHMLNGSIKSNESSENENDDKEKEKEKTNNLNSSVKSNEESNEDNEEVDDNVKMTNATQAECVIDEVKDVPTIQTTPPIENGASEQPKRSPKSASISDPTFEICDFEVKIADLGNACWVDKHFTEGKQSLRANNLCKC